MDDILICQICKEPFSNPLCADCVSENLKKLLSERLRHYVSDFHRIISRTFQFKERLKYCIQCRLSDAPPICWVCYIKEFLNWSKKADPEIIREVKGKIKFRLFQRIKSHRFVPVTEGDFENEDAGICDECGEFSDELHMLEGEWLCSECREHMGA